VSWKQQFQFKSTSIKSGRTGDNITTGTISNMNIIAGFGTLQPSLQTACKARFVDPSAFQPAAAVYMEE
jgi:hypothetical protein